MAVTSTRKRLDPEQVMRGKPLSVSFASSSFPSSSSSSATKGGCCFCSSGFQAIVIMLFCLFALAATDTIEIKMGQTGNERTTKIKEKIANMTAAVGDRADDIEIGAADLSVTTVATVEATEATVEATEATVEATVEATTTKTASITTNEAGVTTAPIAQQPTDPTTAEATTSTNQRNMLRKS